MKYVHMLTTPFYTVTDQYGQYVFSNCGDMEVGDYPRKGSSVLDRSDIPNLLKILERARQRRLGWCNQVLEYNTVHDAASIDRITKEQYTLNNIEFRVVRFNHIITPIEVD